MLVHAARVALAPLLYMQARRLRATALQLPEPHGPRDGTVGSGDVRLRLLVAGDSSAAGVGCRTQDEALALPLARALSHRLGGAVQWQLLAAIGLTSEDLLHRLTNGDVHAADVALVVVGVNDIAREVPLERALRSRARIVAWLRQHAGVRHVFFPAAPEMDRFPALPQPLAWYAGQHSRRNNRAQARWAERLTRDDVPVRHIAFDGVTSPALMAEDGYHPAPPLYARMVSFLADSIAHATTEEERT